MTEFIRVTPDFSVAGQIRPEDVARAQDAGFKVIVVNRPDGEAADQTPGARIRQAVELAGLAFHSLPFAGPPPPNVVAETALLLENAPGPVLAYCRSGRRSITAWGLAQALRGAMRPDAIVAAAAGAGYDLAPFKDVLETLAPPP